MWVGGYLGWKFCVYIKKKVENFVNQAQASKERKRKKKEKNPSIPTLSIHEKPMDQISGSNAHP